MGKEARGMEGGDGEEGRGEEKGREGTQRGPLFEKNDPLSSDGYGPDAREKHFALCRPTLRHLNGASVGPLSAQIFEQVYLGVTLKNHL